MGFAVPVSTAIIVAGLFLAFTAFYPVAENSFDRTIDANQDANDRALERQNTAIEIAAAGRHDTDTNGDQLTIEVVNDGAVGIAISDTSLVISDTYVDPADIETRVVDGDDETTETDLWLPGETLDIQIDDDEMTMDIAAIERVNVVTASGVDVGTAVAAVDIATAKVETKEDEPNELLVDVDNAGAKELTLGDTTVTIDDEDVAVEDLETTAVDDDSETDRWRPDETLELRIADDEVATDVADADTVEIRTDSGAIDTAPVEDAD